MHRLSRSGQVWKTAGTLALIGASLILSVPLSAQGAKPQTTLRGHSGIIECVAFSPDGTTLASGSDDKSIRLWNLATGKKTTLASAESYWCLSLAFSPDGKTLASGRVGNIVELWDLAKRKNTTLLDEVSQFASPKVVFSPDGKTLASGGVCLREIKLWNVATGKNTATLVGHDEYGIRTMTFSPDGKTLISLGEMDGIRSWDVATGKQKKFTPRTDESTPAAAFSPDGKTFATALSVSETIDGRNVLTDKRIKLWDVATGKEVVALAGHTHPASSVIFSPDGKRLASGGADGTIKLWDVARGKELALLEGHKGEVSCLAFSRDGKTLASGGEDKTINSWDVAVLLGKK